jgi:RNA polymerase sigma-70 factor (ECF subfamily)
MPHHARKQNFSSPDFLSRLKTRDNSAIEALVHTYTHQLFRAALGLGFAEDVADEIVQNVWSAFFHSVPKFEGRSHVRTYLFGILYNKASEVHRERRRVIANDAIHELADQEHTQPVALSTPPLDPEQFMIATQTGEMIEQCLEKLPLRQKTAFLLKTVEGHTTEDVCNILDVTPTNLGVLLHRAKSSLRECIHRRVQKEHDD